MKRITQLFILINLLLIAVSANAKEFSYDFTSKVASGWTATPAPTGYETTGSIRGMQFNKVDATLTLKGAKQVSKVVVTVSSNSADQTLEVIVGGKSWGKEALAKEANADKAFTGTAADGDIVITISKGAKSAWVKKIVVTADKAGSDEEEDEDNDLDPAYVYGEPTAINASELTATAYPFVQNNIKIESTSGAINEEYFSCYAGSNITFTTTKAMKAIVVNGYIKKGFEATASSGDIEYADASDEEVTGNPVLFVKNINSKTLTLSCDKQLRCYSVEVYFNENPDVEIEEGGDEGDYNHDYEPQTSKNITVTFDSLFYIDYSEDLGYNFTSLYLTSDDYEMEVAAFAPTVKGKGIAPGTYPINSTYEEGTIQASPGGDDYYDYPTYMCTDFEYDEDYGWYYNTSYYLVSGTLTVEDDAKGVKYTINAKTYYGSTITAIFIGEAVAYDEEGGGGEEEYTYEYEPEEATTINFTSNVLYYIDQSDDYGFDYTSLYMEDDDDSYLELGVFAPSVEGKGIAVGTYQINDSQEAGTVMASPGSDDYNDYPSVFNTHFTEVEDGWYWDSYYLRSGTVKVENDPKGVKVTVDAKTYYGSTFKATFTGKAEKYEDPEAINDINADNTSKDIKKIENGRIVICKGDKKFNVEGIRIK